MSQHIECSDILEQVSFSEIQMSSFSTTNQGRFFSPSFELSVIISPESKSNCNKVINPRMEFF